MEINNMLIMKHRKTDLELKVLDPIAGFDYAILNQLNSIGFDVYKDEHQEASVTIDGGNITTDSLTFSKLVDFCGCNNIKLSIIDGHINLNV